MEIDRIPFVYILHHKFTNQNRIVYLRGCLNLLLSCVRNWERIGCEWNLFSWMIAKYLQIENVFSLSASMISLSYLLGDLTQDENDSAQISHW